MRITPACAGKTHFAADRGRTFRDHPRVCGENIGTSSPMSHTGGSPPRVRGKRHLVENGHVKWRITPACAGKTCGFTAFIDKSEDHPRVCGENLLHFAADRGAAGSPPRVRGKRRRRAATRVIKRITPACAGKTGCTAVLGRNGKDHPRVCGENNQHSQICAICGGSPPRVRGKRNTACCSPLLTGITPACAGKTQTAALPLTQRRDHPRVCGENIPTDTIYYP